MFLTTSRQEVRDVERNHVASLEVSQDVVNRSKSASSLRKRSAFMSSSDRLVSSFDSPVRWRKPSFIRDGATSCSCWRRPSWWLLLGSPPPFFRRRSQEKEKRKKPSPHIHLVGSRIRRERREALALLILRVLLSTHAQPLLTPYHWAVLAIAPYGRPHLHLSSADDRVRGAADLAKTSTHAWGGGLLSLLDFRRLLFCFRRVE